MPKPPPTLVHLIVGLAAIGSIFGLTLKGLVPPGSAAGSIVVVMTLVMHGVSAVPLDRKALLAELEPILKRLLGSRAVGVLEELSADVTLPPALPPTTTAIGPSEVKKP